MERSYSGHDGIVYFGLFDRWIMSVVGVKQLYNEIDGGLNRSAMYRFKDATVSFLESGDVKMVLLCRLELRETLVKFLMTFVKL